MTLVFVPGDPASVGNASDRSVRKVQLRDAVIGDVPLRLIVDETLSQRARLVACIMWSQSQVIDDGRRVIAWKAEHVASVLGVQLAAAAKMIRELREAGYVAKITIPVPHFDEATVPGYWLGPDEREAIRGRNARDRAAKAHGRRSGRSSAEASPEVPPKASGAPETAAAPLATTLEGTRNGRRSAG